MSWERMILLIYLAHITRISNNAGDDNMWLVYFLILRNVKKEEVFVYQNSSLIQTIGVLIALNGLFR